jgi:predicted amidohydrolase
VRLTVLELPATWNDGTRVLAAVARALAHGPRSDLVLLPEASLTGYVSAHGDFDLSRFAEPLDGPTRHAVAQLAREARVHVVAPLVLREGDANYNAMIALDPEGELVFTYRKRHPWIPECWASAGTQAAPIVTIAGARVTVATCFDVHFLEEDAAATLDAADLLLFPSAWVSEQDELPTLLPALARRHCVAVANANWSPGVVVVAGQGGSSIHDRHGTRICHAVRLEQPGILRLDASLDEA